MATHWNNKTKVILLAILIILWGAMNVPKAISGSYTDSIHGGGWGHSDGVDRSTIDAKYSNYAPGNCAHCHEAHASLGGGEPFPNSGVDAGPDSALLFSAEEHFCEECHDGNPVLKNIQAELDKTHRHPTHDTSGEHTLSKLEYGQGGAPFRGANRHAECPDCHNPHTIGGIDTNTPKIHPRGSTPARDENGNLIYHASFGTAALQGVWGVEPVSWPGSWTSPTSFTETLPASTPPYPRYAEKEYQICFKCHSYYGLGTSDGDMAREFNPNNKSAHPVVVTTENQTGSVVGWGGVDKGLTGIQLLAPWKWAHCTMYCSDCHGADYEGVNDPQGVHGMNAQFSPPLYWGTDIMLRSFWLEHHHYWPLSPLHVAFDPDWSLKKVRYNEESWDQALFCRGCHGIKDVGSQESSAWANKVHYDHSDRFDSQCTACHVRRVHGSQLGRLMGGKVEGFRKMGKDSYTMGDCYAPDCSYHGVPIE